MLLTLLDKRLMQSFVSLQSGQTECLFSADQNQNFPHTRDFKICHTQKPTNFIVILQIMQEFG
jgi:hypothetical protein